MELRTLYYFITVAEELNITKAADKLNMCQPPLSSQMKNLEKELDSVLFIRGKRQLTLTDSGQLLYRRAKEILALAEKAETEIKSMGKGMTGVISLGLVEGMAPTIASEWFADFYTKHPNVKFRILDGSSDDLVEKLRSGLISMAVITMPYDQMLLNGFSLGKERMTALMNKDHPLAQSSNETVSINDLVYQPIIVPSRRSTIEMIRKWFATLDAEPNIVCEMDSYLDAAALAERGVGISIFPKTAYRGNEDLVSKDIEGDDKFIEYIFVWRKGHPLPTIEKMFIDYIKDKVTAG